MAVNLKARKKCHIVPPDWLNYGELVRLVSFLGLTDNLGRTFARLFERRDNIGGFQRTPF